MTDNSRRTKSKPATPVALARAQVSRQLSRRLPYYLMPDEAHRIISAAQNPRDQLFLRMLWRPESACLKQSHFGWVTSVGMVSVSWERGVWSGSCMSRMV